MAKKLINNTQELINKARYYGINTENTSASIEEIGDAVITHLLFCHDLNLPGCKNDNKDKIFKEIQDIKDFLETLKEDTTEEAKSTTNCNETKEVITMKKETLATRILNMNKAERLMHVRDSLINATKTTDELYIKKEELVQFLFDNDIISRMPSKNELKKAKRQEFVDILMTAVQNLIDAKVITPINAVSVGDLDITHDNAPANDAMAKTNELFKLIQTDAKKNKDKGYGTTISAYMLCAYILQAGHGIKKLKGHEHEITPEQKDSVKSVRNWLITHGYIKTVVFKDEKGFIFYTPEYDGNGKDNLWDATKYQSTGKLDTISYLVTEKAFV